MPKTEIVKIGSEEVEAVRDESGNGWVVVKKVCEVLGVDHSGQIKRLKDLPWPVMEMISMTAADGKIYKQLCISTESAPQWLATINPAKVAPKVKPKLIQFQKLAAKAIADWFFGRNGAGSSFQTDRLNDTLDRLITSMATLTSHVMTLKLEPAVRAISPRVELEEDEGDITRLSPRKIRTLLGKIVSRSTDRGHGYEYRSGWDKLYRLYGRETGIDLYQTAISMSQTQRKEVKPLDLAEKWGHLIPLYKFALANMRPGAPRELLDPPTPTSPTKDEGTNFISEEDLKKISDFDSFYH
jgi:hypothetical protein